MNPRNPRTRVKSPATKPSVNKLKKSQSNNDNHEQIRQLINDACATLSVEQIYTDPSHKFKPSGDKFRGGCPYHESKSGTSFVVNDSSKLFYCPGCSFGGSVIDYIHSLRVGRWENPKGKDFIDAAKELASLAGLQFPEREYTAEEINQARKWEERKSMLEVVYDYCQQVLWSERGEQARRYLIEERGLTEQGIRDLGLGLYLSANEVQQELEKRQLNVTEAKQDWTLIWKKLEGYIIYPWYDSYGKPLTIYGRYQSKSTPDGRPKTIAVKGQGTKDSPLYLDRVLKAGHTEAVFVEGVNDAAMLQSSGDTRVVAYVGGSCSSGQIKTTKQSGIELVTVCGDPDTGGDNGTYSNVIRMTKAGIAVFVAPRLPDGLDPDEFLIRYGLEVWRKHIAAAIHGYTWIAQRLIAEHDPSTDKGKFALQQAAIAFSKTMESGEEKTNLTLFFWPEICKALGVPAEEFVYTNLGGGDAGNGGRGDDGDGEYGDDGDDEYENDGWDAPVSWNGQIGWIETKKVEKMVLDPETGEMTPALNSKGKPIKETIKKFIAKCNFDFVVERELESSDGGGLVLQVKRFVDLPNVQKRVVIKSTDYTEPGRFIDALKAALGTGIVCTLRKEDLGALVHRRLKDYRDRGGKVYKLVSCIGQQSDGTWVFRDRQYKADGTPTSEDESLWVFDDNLGKEDYIPDPILAPEQPEGLKLLVDASRNFFGSENIHQVLLTMGWVVAGIHFQQIFRDNNNFPLLNSYGEPGSCKTLAAEAALSLIGKNWPQVGMLARVSTSALYEHGSKTGSLPFAWDDPERSPQTEELCKSWYNAKARLVRGNKQEPKSPLGIISNHVFGGEQAATFTRFIRINYERKNKGNKQAFQELREAMNKASGAFPMLLKIGYPKQAIAELEHDLLAHLPMAHARIAQSLAIVTYYAQKLVELTEGTENIQQWVIENLCRAENDSDSAGDSLQDFIEKILALESESLIGDWNKQRVTTRDGNEWIALHHSDIWSLVDKHYKPATYNQKSLKPLVLKAGGRIDSTQKFDISRDETLAYHRAMISPRTLDGEAVPLNQPRTVPRKCWLLPVSLFDASHSPVTESCQELPDSVTRQDAAESSFLGSNNNPVTEVTKNINININNQAHIQKCSGGEFIPTVEICEKNSSGTVSLVTKVTSVTSEVTQTESFDTQGVEQVTPNVGNSVTPPSNSGNLVTSPLSVGKLVKIDFPGSQHDGKTGTIVNINEEDDQAELNNVPGVSWNLIFPISKLVAIAIE